MICSTCTLPVAFNLVGSAWRLQLQYCKHQKAAQPLLFKLHCSLSVCYRGVWEKGRNETARRYQERQTTWVWKQRQLKPTRDLGTWICFINHSELAGREEKAEERKDQKRGSPEERDIPSLSVPECFPRQWVIAKAASCPGPLWGQGTPCPAEGKHCAMLQTALCPGLLSLLSSSNVSRDVSTVFEA